MLSKFISDGTINICLVGIGVLGVIVQIILSMFVKSNIKASANMVTTRKKVFKNMRQKYENNRSLGLVVTDYDAFIDKYLMRIKLIGIPLYNMQNAMKILRTLAFLVAWGGIGYSMLHGESSVIIEEMVIYGVGVIAFLYLLEHIIPIKNKVGLMKVNARDYLLNSAISRRRERKKYQDSTEKQENSEKEASVTCEADKNKNPKTPSDDDVLAHFLKNYLRE